MPRVGSQYSEDESLNHYKNYSQMSRHTRKPTICLCENKGADQLCILLKKPQHLKRSLCVSTSTTNNNNRLYLTKIKYILIFLVALTKLQNEMKNNYKFTQNSTNHQAVERLKQNDTDSNSHSTLTSNKVIKKKNRHYIQIIYVIIYTKKYTDHCVKVANRQ